MSNQEADTGVQEYRSKTDINDGKRITANWYQLEHKKMLRGKQIVR